MVLGRATEIVAAVRIAGFQPLLQCSHALFRRTVCEHAFDRGAPCIAHQLVITDGVCSPHAFLDISSFNARCIFGRPYTGIAICLQLHPNLERVTFGLTGTSLRTTNPIGDTGEVLDMMADFMRDNIGISEIAAAAHLLHLLEEGSIEIDPLIGRAIKGAHRRLGRAAA